MTLRVAIAGASGYAGGELARLLAGHPDVSYVTLAAHTHAGEPVSSIHPHLASYAGRVFEPTSLETLSGHDVLILALPHGESGEWGDSLLASGDQRLLIDVGADRRLVDSTQWSAFYSGKHHAPFVYGMPELPRADGATQRDLIAEANALAIPGCNATAVTLALAPLVRAGLVTPYDMSAVLAVGPSGAGRVLRADLLASELLGSARAYAVGGSHRHLPEIEQNLSLAGAQDPSVSMTPVLVPMSRGILATCTARLSSSSSAEDLHEVLSSAYAHESFLRVLPLGSFPNVSDVVGSNTLALGVAVDARVNRAVVVSAVDNLLKGTAGAAVQCMNIALGLHETAGLTTDGVAP